MLLKAFCSCSRLIVELAACSPIWALWVRSSSEVDSIRLPVVVLRAVIWSRTSFWLASAWATMTAVRSADTVVVVARSTPLISSRLLRRITSSAR